MSNIQIRDADAREEWNDDTRSTNASSPDLITALRAVEVFADLPGEQLRWFAENAEERRLQVGDILIRKGEPAETMIVVLEGEIQARPEEAQINSYIYIARAGDPATEVSGKLPFSRMSEWASTARATLPTRVLVFHSRLFPEMLGRMPLLAERLVGVMSDRVREFTRANEQRDKLISLGKLSAGLAHELNNPASAARRAADELTGTLEELRAADLRLCRHNLTGEQRRFVAEFEREAIVVASESQPLSALEQSDHEDELNTWLDSHGVKDGWKLSTALVEAGVDVAALELVAKQIEGGAVADVLARIAAQLSTARLTSDIKTSAGRISELVGAIKEYSYMDKAPVQRIDLRKSLENTLLILKYKLKKKSVSVTREYDESVPSVTAYGSELNQVWTNLIDNAVDAMAEGGELKVRTKLEPADVLIEIRDDGAGISPEVQPRIFEPFYTTKGVGEGTGLGLDTVYRIVRRHRGDIRVESKPGDTCFQVRLPLDIKE